MVTNKLDLQKELADAQRQSDESLMVLTEIGFVPDTNQWLSINRYAEKYGIDIQRVSILVAGGTIPADCIRDLPEVNNIRLIKDIHYQ